MARRLLVLAVLGGCLPSQPLPEGHCSAVVWAQPERAGARLELVGSWDDWDRRSSLRRFDATWWVAELALPPGRYGYLVVEEGQGRLDDYNALSTFRESDGLEVSLLDVADCSAPRIEVETVDSLVFTLGWTRSRDEAPIDPDTIAVAGATATVADVADDRVTIEVAGLPPGKHTLEITAADTAGIETSRRAVAWVDPRAPTLADEIVYQVVIDRFRGDDGVALSPPPQPGARASIPAAD